MTINLHIEDIWELSFVVVEFFFLLTGFFMMQHAQKENSLNTPSFLFKKISSVYPIFIVAFAMQFVLFVLTTPLNSALEVGGALFHFKWEAMFMQTAGFIQNPQFNIDYLLGQAWYLSAMMISLLVLYPIARKLKKTFSQIICPIIVILIYAYMNTVSGTLNVGTEFYGFISSAVVRAIAGTCMGALTFGIYSHFKEKGIKKIKPAITIEVVAYISLALLLFMGMFNNPFVSSEDGLFYVLVFATIILFAMLNKTPVSRFINTHGTKVINYLGSLSLYLYLLHCAYFVVCIVYVWHIFCVAVCCLIISFEIKDF